MLQNGVIEPQNDEFDTHYDEYFFASFTLPGWNEVTFTQYMKFAYCQMIFLI